MPALSRSKQWRPGSSHREGTGPSEWCVCVFLDVATSAMGLSS